MKTPDELKHQPSQRLALLEQLVERAPGVLLVVDRNLGVREANEAAAARIGTTRSALTGERIGNLFRCVNASRGGGCGTTDQCGVCKVKAGVQAAIDEGCSQLGVEARLETLDGDMVTLLLGVTPIQADGATLAVVSATDITAQKKAESIVAERLVRWPLLLGRVADRELAERDRGFEGAVGLDPSTGISHPEFRPEQFQHLIDALPGGTYVARSTVPFGILRVSEGLSALMEGDGPAQPADLEQGWLQYVHEDDRQRVGLVLEQAASEGQPYALEYRLLGSDGSIRHVEDWGIRVLFQGASALQGTVIDVTESRRADRNLRLQRDLGVCISSARNLETVLQETIRAAILIADGDCGGIYVIEPSGWVRLVESVGLSQDFVAAVSMFEPGSREAREMREGLGFVYSQDDLVRFNSPAIPFDGIRCMAGVPAIHDGGVIAWIIVGSHSRSDFPLSSRASLQVMAGQFASSLAAWMAREEYQHILQTSVDGLWVVSPEGTLLEVNDAYCQMTGWSREELVGNGIRSIVEQAGHEDRLAGMVLGTQKAFESRHRCRDGSVLDVEVMGRFAPRVRGGAVVVVIRDISERLARERHLRLLSRVVEQNPTGVVVTDAGGRIAYVNPRFTTLAGYSAEELVGRSSRFLRGLFRAEGMYRQIYQATRRGMEWHGDVALRSKNGQVKWVRASVTALRGADGGITQYIGVVKDISDTRAALDALRVSERRLAVAMEGSRDGLWDWDVDGNAVYLSPAWFALLGYESDEIPQNIEAVWDLVHPEDVEALRRDTAACVAGELARIERRARLRHKSGGYVTVLVRGLCPRPEAGHARHFVGTIADLTEQERVQQQLIDARDQAESASRAKTAFLANMSHEIRTPMNAILGYAQLLLRETGLTDRQRGYVGTILRSGDHLLNLINDVLAMSQIEAGRAKLSVRSFDWWTLLTDIERMLREKAESKRLRLEMVRQPSVPHRLTSDEGKIRQIIVNLVGNAIKFTDEGLVAVRVSARPAMDGALWHEVVVTDTGIGMHSDEISQIFRPFEQGSGASRKHAEGTGLGLAISADFARLLGGEITVDSHAGRGSTFRFRFPAAIAGASTTSDSAKVRLGGNRIVKLASANAGARALVVDDTASNREVLVRMLEGLGFLVREASNGHDAVEIFRHFTPNVILLDRRMPGIDGYATMRGIRGVVGGRRAKVLIVTASALEEDREEALALGADGFVAKPVVEAQLVAELERAAGFRFVDHGDVMVPVPMGSRRAPPLPAASRDSVPPELADAMRRAAEVGNLDELLKLVPRLGEAQRELQDSLTLSLEQFDYDAVIAWLDRGSDRKK